MDALAHNLEAYCAPGFHPMADGIALEGMRLIDKWLLVAVKDGSNIDARMNMLTAASMGSTAFQKGLGAIHSLSLVNEWHLILFEMQLIPCLQLLAYSFLHLYLIHL